MSQLSETFRCGDGDALVTYIYGEASPAERDAIVHHLAWCTACATDVAALGGTRERLAAWTPPEQPFGFRITRAEADATGAATTTPTATILRPAAWWKQPLPAWAQMAAGVALFVSGMVLGGTWSSPAASAPAVATTSGSPTAATVNTAPTAVTREELADVERRLRGEIAQVRVSAPAESVTPGDTRALMQRVNQLIAASEARQQNELNLRTAVMTRDWSNRRTLDLANIEQRLGSTTVRVLSNQQDINSLAQRVGYSPNYSPYVP